MAVSSNESTRWKPVALSSALLVSLCVAFGYLDIAAHFSFDLTDYYGAIFVIGALAAICCGVAIIGWARHLRRQGRVLLAIAVLLWPWAILLIGLPFAGTNIHGPAAPVLVSIWPVSILAVVLFVMAGVAKENV